MNLKHKYYDKTIEVQRSDLVDLALTESHGSEIQCLAEILKNIIHRMGTGSDLDAIKMCNIYNWELVNEPKET